MTAPETPPPAPVEVAPPLPAPSGEGVAPDLPTLMERMERTRKHLRVEREYIKLVLIGGWFILMGAILTPGFPWRMILLLALGATPFLLGWYNLPLLRLANAFKNETLPFLLRDYGRWNYALAGSHFSRDQVQRTGLIDPADTLSIGSIMTGERGGVPLQLALVSAWPAPRFGIYRGAKASFEGWGINIRLPDLPLTPALLLPHGVRPATRETQGWKEEDVTTSFRLYTPSGSVFPPALVARLLPVMQEQPQTRFALLDGVLWILLPASPLPFAEAGGFTDALYEPAPYERSRTALSAIFGIIDTVLWPRF